MSSIDIEKAIVQIFADHNEYSYVTPWNIMRTYRSTSTGFCIKVGGRKYILTNAHCVHNSKYITIRKRGNASLFKFKVKFIIYECDLALLSLDRKTYNKPKLIEEFWNDIPELTFGGTPEKLDKVYVYGYPLGGYNISITKGVVNRIQIITYFSSTNGIAIQIDAPINFGNSGGPVVDNSDKVIGVAFSGEDDRFTQNMGYIIPNIIIEYFIKYVQSGIEFKGLCSLGIHTQPLNNPSLREYLGITNNDGVLINQIDPLGSCAGILKLGDVILSIDEIPVRYDGNIMLHHLIKNDNNEEVPYSNILSLKLPGEQVHLTIMRNKNKKILAINIKPKTFVIPVLEYQIKPSYFIYAGMVFLPVSYMLINEKKKNNEYVHHLINLAEESILQKPDEQFIILSQIYHTDITEGYDEGNYVLDSVNNIEILNLAHLHEVVYELIKKSKYLIFKFRDTKNIIVINSYDAKQDHKKILSDNLGIEQDYSPSKQLLLQTNKF